VVIKTDYIFVVKLSQLWLGWYIIGHLWSFFKFSMHLIQRLSLAYVVVMLPV